MKASRIRASSETLVFHETSGNKDGQWARLLKIAAAALFDRLLWPSLPVPASDSFARKETVPNRCPTVSRSGTLSLSS